MSQQLFATFYPKTQKLDGPLPRSQRFIQTAEIKRKHLHIKNYNNNSFRSSNSRNSCNSKIEDHSKDYPNRESEQYESQHTFEDDMIMRYERVCSRDGYVDNPYAAMKLKQLGLQGFEGAYKSLKRLDRSYDDSSNQDKIFNRQGLFKENSYSLKLERSEIVDKDDNSDKSQVVNVINRHKAQESQMEILQMQTQYKQQSQESLESTEITNSKIQRNHYEYPYLITKLNITNQLSAQEALQINNHGRILQTNEDSGEIECSQDNPTEESQLDLSINRHFYKKEAGNNKIIGTQDHYSSIYANKTNDKSKKTNSIDRIAGIRMRAFSQNCKRLEATAASPSHTATTFIYQNNIIRQQNYDKYASFIEGTTPKTILNNPSMKEHTQKNNNNTSPMKQSTIDRQTPKRTYLLGRTREEWFKQIGSGNSRFKGNNNNNTIGSGCEMRTQGVKQHLNLLERLQNYQSKARKSNISQLNQSCNNNILRDTSANDTTSSDIKQFRKWNIPKQQYQHNQNNQ